MCRQDEVLLHVISLKSSYKLRDQSFSLALTFFLGKMTPKRRDRVNPHNFLRHRRGMLFVPDNKKETLSLFLFNSLTELFLTDTQFQFTFQHTTQQFHVCVIKRNLCSIHLKKVEDNTAFSLLGGRCALLV